MGEGRSIWVKMAEVIGLLQPTSVPVSTPKAEQMPETRLQLAVLMVECERQNRLEYIDYCKAWVEQYHQDVQAGRREPNPYESMLHNDFREDFARVLSLDGNAEEFDLADERDAERLEIYRSAYPYRKITFGEYFDVRRVYERLDGSRGNGRERDSLCSAP